MIKSATARSLVVVAALMAFAVVPALATTVVIPNVNQNSPGPSNNAFPFNSGGMRVQQVFARDQFQGLTGTITQIAFRVDESFGGPFNSAPIDTEVRLCHTNVAPTAMNLNFAANYGGDVTLVYDGPLTLSSAGGGLFDIVINVNPIFNYNGTQNLLVEYKVFSAAATTQFDTAGTGYGEGGTLWVDRLWAFGAEAASGSSDGDDGYVTQFTLAAATAVEPTSWGAIKATFKD
jgi:hypothetical protein